MKVPWTPSTSTVWYEVASRGMGMTRVEVQSTVWQNAWAASALIPASCNPASATWAILRSGGTLTVGLGTSARNVQPWASGPLGGESGGGPPRFGSTQLP